MHKHSIKSVHIYTLWIRDGFIRSVKNRIHCTQTENMFNRILKWNYDKREKKNMIAALMFVVTKVHGRKTEMCAERRWNEKKKVERILNKLNKHNQTRWQNHHTEWTTAAVETNAMTARTVYRDYCCCPSWSAFLLHCALAVASADEWYNSATQSSQRSVDSHAST